MRCEEMLLLVRVSSPTTAMQVVNEQAMMMDGGEAQRMGG
jgi:hypothetical protein